jgi:hypothetical protein
MREVPCHHADEHRFHHFLRSIPGVAHQVDREFVLEAADPDVREREHLVAAFDDGAILQRGWILKMTNASE